MTRIIVAIASLSLALCAFFPHRPVFLPFVTAGCQPSLLHEQTFALQYDKTRFIVDLNPCSDQWREVQYVEFRDFRFPFTVHAYRSE